MLFCVCYKMITLAETYKRKFTHLNRCNAVRGVEESETLQTLT